VVLVLALRLSELNQTRYLGHRKSGKSLVKLLNRFSEVLTSDDGVRHDAGSAHHGPARYFAGHAFN
jgi:hypothetical protein